MDKKKVKELIEKISEDIEQYTAAKSYCSFETKKMILKQLEEVKSEIQKSDWVSVEDGLPEYGEKVLVHCGNTGLETVMTRHYNNLECVYSKLFDSNGFLDKYNVTHWKPIEKLEE